MTSAKILYFIEIDGCISLQAHPGPRETAFDAALEQSRQAACIRVIAIEGDDPLSESAKRSFYRFDRRERRWIKQEN